MNSQYTIREGHALSERHLRRLVNFLHEQGLKYDEPIDYTVILEENDGRIIGTGSCARNVMKCVAIREEYQGLGLMASIVTKLLTHMALNNVKHAFVYTKPKNMRVFADMQFYPIIQTDEILLMENKKNGICDYVDSLKDESAKYTQDASIRRIGAIIANCNPFTKGHQYLMQYAATKCDCLHIFVLSEENGMFSSGERFEMVRAGTMHLENVILHSTSEYLVSPATFPTYFIKDDKQAEMANYALDIAIFQDIIAKELGINVRFVGTEPYCAVTKQYNEAMKKSFNYIKVVEIPRFEVDGVAVSASAVRKLIDERCWDALETLLPQTTLDIIKMSVNGMRSMPPSGRM